MTETPDQARRSGLSVLRHCLNPKVLAGLALVGLVVWWIQPELIRSVLPVLLFLACPLSMLFMMRAMGGSSEDPPPPGLRADRATELRERLARARAEEEVLQGELARMEADETVAKDDREPR